MMFSIKSCDFPMDVAANTFAALNKEDVTLIRCGPTIIIATDQNPKMLFYLEGWYYDYGYLTNKGNTTTGFYSSIPMKKSSGEDWSISARYCTKP